MIEIVLLLYVSVDNGLLVLAQAVKAVLRIYLEKMESVRKSREDREDKLEM